jgi:phage anti-repressor protein
MKTSFILLLFFLFSVSSSKQWYASSTKGDDTAQGTRNSPFKTFNKAYETMLSGDTVVLDKGVYNAIEEVIKDINIVGLAETNAKDDYPIIRREFKFKGKQISIQKVIFEKYSSQYFNINLQVFETCNSFKLQHVIFRFHKDSVVISHHLAMSLKIPTDSVGFMDHVQFLDFEKHYSAYIYGSESLFISNVLFNNCGTFTIERTKSLQIRGMEFINPYKSISLKLFHVDRLEATGIISQGEYSGIEALWSRGIIEESKFIGGGKNTILKSWNSTITFQNVDILQSNVVSTQSLVSVGNSGIITLIKGKWFRNIISAEGFLKNCISGSGEIHMKDVEIHETNGRSNCGQ